MEYNAFINSFPIQMDVFDDITYLQKSLRMTIDLHQKLSPKLYITTSLNGKAAYPSKNFSAVRLYMDFLEQEMEQISKEQESVINILCQCLSQYLETLRERYNVLMEQDIAEGFISRALNVHYEKYSANIAPANVKIRLSENEMNQKHEEFRKVFDAELELYRRMEIVNKQQQQGSAKFRKPVTTGRVDKSRYSKLTVKKTNGVQEKKATENRLKLANALKKVKNYSGCGRSDEDCSEHSSLDSPVLLYPVIETLKAKRGRRRRSPASNASIECVVRPLPILPDEPPAKTEYTQEEFLGLLQLVRPNVAEQIKIQKTKRKRRNCFKKDFYYGNFDLNEAS